MCDQPDGIGRGIGRTVEIFVDLVVENGFDVAGTDKRLAHHVGVDIELDIGTAAGLKVALKTGRDEDREGIIAFVECFVGLTHLDHIRFFEVWRCQGVRYPVRELGLVLIDDSYRGVMDFL